MASNEELYNQRSFKRTVSETVKTSEESSPRLLTRRSESYNDTRELEDIVTCSIHLGIMDDPRKLFCQHAFCYKCLKEYSKTIVDLICPICKVKEKISDIDKLPSGLTEKQLIDVVMKRRLNKCMENCNESVSLSDDQKEELVKHILKEINSSNGIYKVSNKNEDFNGKTSEDQIRMTSYLENRHIGSTTSLAYDMMDIETIRENMLKHSQFEVVKRDAVQKIYKNLYQNKNENIQLNFSLFDVNISSNHSRLNQLVLVECESSQLIVYSESLFRTFHIYIQNKIVKPDYIKIVRGDLIITGHFDSGNGMMSVFLQCNMNGEIIRLSNCYSWPDQSSLPLMLGFDFNNKEEKYYLCLPKMRTVRIFDSSLVECHQIYEFDENKPEYIALCSSQNQLWISCPENRRIIILDIDSGVFRTFNTEQINKAIPKMIFVTDDEKIIFLDTRGNRFIWIKRRNEYILTQKLHIPSINQDLLIKAFQVLPYSMIIVGSEKEILIFQSTKYFSRSRRIIESCNVL